jgi:hypothetical protein
MNGVLRKAGRRFCLSNEGNIVSQGIARLLAARRAAASARSKEASRLSPSFDRVLQTVWNQRICEVLTGFGKQLILKWTLAVW